MKRYSKKILLLALLLFTGLSATAQNLLVDVPKVVAQDETFRLVFTAKGDVENFNPPDLQGFDVLVGPSTSTMYRSETINGKSNSWKEISYTYVLRGKEVGKFTIHPAQAKVDGKIEKSQPVTVEVVKAEAKSAAQQVEESAAQTGTVSDEDIFMKMSVDKRRVVEGEPIVVTLKLYTRVDISAFQDIKFPSFNGFWNQEIEAPTNLTFERENYDNKIYNSAVIRKWVLIPQQTGRVSIEPSELVTVLQVRATRSAPRSIFEDFFDSGYRNVRKRLIAPKLDIEVSPLPGGAPESFGGAVGNYKIDVKLGRQDMKAHEASSLIVTISGSGNLNLIEAPKINLPPDFEKYDVKRSENISNNSGGIRGSKSFEYPFIPRSHGDFTIPATEFTYYDVAQKRYITLNSEPVSVHVERGSETQSQTTTAIPFTMGKTVQNLGEDIRYIATSPVALSKTGSLFVASPLFFILAGIFIILFFVIYFVLGSRIKRRADVMGSRNRKAKKMAKVRLKNAAMLLKQDLYSAFYEELYKAILGYVADKLMLQISELNRDRIAWELTGRGLPQEKIDRLFALMDACEYARYAPSQGSAAMEGHYNDALNFLSESI